MNSAAPIRIDKKIVGVKVIKANERTPDKEDSFVKMGEHVNRPDTLVGATYKVRSADDSMPSIYVTINDIVLNPGTKYETRRPFEIFINSKNMEHFQWIVALTRVISAVFRKGGDVTFLVEELASVFDPRGGYFRPGEGYIPSLIADLGNVIRRHLQGLGMMEKEARRADNVTSITKDDSPIGVTRPACPKCYAPDSLIKSAGCEQCVCGEYTRCG